MRKIYINIDNELSKNIDKRLLKNIDIDKDLAYRTPIHSAGWLAGSANYVLGALVVGGGGGMMFSFWASHFKFFGLFFCVTDLPLWPDMNDGDGDGDVNGAWDDGEWWMVCAEGKKGRLRVNEI